MATPSADLRGIKKKESQVAYLKAFFQSKNPRSDASEAGISLGTSYHWRQLILTTLSDFLPNKLSALVKCRIASQPYLEKRKYDTSKKPINHISYFGHQIVAQKK